MSESNMSYANSSSHHYSSAHHRGSHCPSSGHSPASLPCSCVIYTMLDIMMPHTEGELQQKQVGVLCSCRPGCYTNRQSDWGRG